MRRLVAAPGAPAVMAKWPGLRPLYHWQIIEGVRFQSYRIDSRIRIPDRFPTTRGSASSSTETSGSRGSTVPRSSIAGLSGGSTAKLRRFRP